MNRDARQGLLPLFSRAPVPRFASRAALRGPENSAVATALVFAFLAVGAMALCSIATDTLFVSAFGLGQISRFYIVTALVRVLAAVTLTALLRRYQGPRLDTLLLVIAAATSLGSGLMSRSATGPLLYAICVIQLILPPLLPLIAINATTATLEPRATRRLLPLVAAAGTVGTIVVGALVPVLVRTLGAPGLLYAAALFILAASPLPRILAAQSPKVRAPRSSRRAPTPVATYLPLRRALVELRDDLAASPTVVIVLAAALLGATTSNLIDYAFKAALKARYDRDQMAAFLGHFGVLVNLVVLFAQLAGTSRFIARFGVTAAMESVFGSAFVTGPWIALALAIPSAGLAKFAETVSRFSLGTPVADLLLTPNPPAIRSRAKVVAKGVAAPIGALCAGFALSSFGEHGPPSWALGAMLIGTAALGMFVVSHARRAYTSGLARALGQGRAIIDASPEHNAVVKREILVMLKAHASRGDVAAARRMLDLFDERYFCLEDLAPALAARNPAIRHAAIAVAARVARPDEGFRLLDLAGPDEGLAAERLVLSTARALGAEPNRSRLERALGLARGRGDDDSEAIALWAESLICLARSGSNPALKELRQAALAHDSPRRAAALGALGEIGDRRAEREVLLALASENGQVFAAAARAAILLDAPGAVATLIARLSSGPHVRAAARALSLAGADAINDLIAMLPTTRGKGALMPTAIASGRTVIGTVRAARVLARLGPRACARVLLRFGDLGYRARNAVARAFAAMPRREGECADEEPVLKAMDLTLAYAESLSELHPSTGPGLLRRELRHRIEETVARLLDLASVIGDRERIKIARAALSLAQSERGNALELLENVLPRPLGARAVALLELDWDAAPVSARWSKPPELDGWLEKCRAFDEGGLGSLDPMLGVLEKVLLLRDASLFLGLSGEELYPVAEIAEAMQVDEGDVVVIEGDPGDALFVVASGSYDAKREGVTLRALGKGDVFGEMALLDGAPRAATVVAREPGRLLRIPREEFEALLDESPELSRGVIRTLLDHIRKSRG